jgi:hypothetical protein
MPLAGKRLSADQALGVARRWVSSSSPLRSASSVQLVHAERDSVTGFAGVYVCNIGAGDGFVLIAGDDRARPVLGYAESGRFEPQQMPVNIKGWLQFYQREMCSLPEDTSPASDADLVRTPSLRSDVSASTVLLETACWDQTAPYNDQCPLNSQGKRTVTGCVATAMGEVMHFHRHPPQGSGNSTFAYIDNMRPTVLYVYFGVDYQWDDMLSVYRESLWTPAQADAVSQLLYHCGRAAGMNYSLSGSGATSFAMQEALINNFSYDAGCYLAFRDRYDKAEWEDLIRREISDRRPVLYSGNSDQVGHMFVVDGFTADGFFHVNWGWNGVSNGFFLLSSLNPSEQGAGGGSVGSGFNTLQDAMIGLRPATSETGLPHYELFFGYFGNDIHGQPGISASVSDFVSGYSFKLYYSHLLNYGYRFYSGKCAFCVVDDAGNIKETLHIIDWNASKTKLIPNSSYSDRSGIRVTINSTIRPGDRIRFYYTLEDDTWAPVPGAPGAVVEIPIAPAAPSSILPAAVSSPATLLRYDLQGRPIPAGITPSAPYIEVTRSATGVGSAIRTPRVFY